MGNKKEASYLKFYIIILIGGLLIAESFFAFRYSSDLNLGVIMPGFIGAVLISFSIRPLLFHALVQKGVTKGISYTLVKPINRKVKKVIIIFLILVIAFFTVVEGLIIADPYLHRSELAGKVDYLVVLGCGIWPDGRPTLALIYRLDKAIEYYTKNHPIKIIVSGGQGVNEPYSEARAMAEYLIQKGIPSENIMLEERSTSTMENFQYTRELLGDKVSEPIRIVFITNDFHVLRSRILAKRNGFDAYALPAATPSVILLNSYLREFFAFVKSMLVDY